MTDLYKTERHISVLLNETLELLVPLCDANSDFTMVDGTLGFAGHSIAFLKKYPNMKLIGVDADRQVQAMAKERLSPFVGRFSLVNSYFDDFFYRYKNDIENGLATRPSLVLFDFGVSMFHFREANRGFSLTDESSLDMRLNLDGELKAEDIVNDYSKEEIEHILYTYGEESFANRIASSICNERKASRITNSVQLAQIIKNAVPAKFRNAHIHPATKSFQALRIAVNDELGRLERGLSTAIECLSPGGSIACISFHSLEDRIVKQIFKNYSLVKTKINRYREHEYFNASNVSPISTEETKQFLIIKNKKPILASQEELDINPASRSAKLRVATRISTNAEVQR